MKRTGVSLCILALAALAVIAGAGGAAAKATRWHFPGPQVFSRLQRTIEHGADPARSTVTPHLGFTLKAGHGYLVSVLGLGRQAVGVLVTRPHQDSHSGYAAKGSVSDGRISASFEGFGSVHMRFLRSSDKVRTGSRDCRGASRFVRRRGVFVGSFRFRGEHGYVSVRAHRAKGAVVTVARRCERGTRGPSRPRPLVLRGRNENAESATLVAGWRHGGSVQNFAAYEARQGFIFLAQSAESRGSVAIFHEARSTADDGLSLNDSLTEAEVSPPRPFSGSGTYRAAPDGTVSWDGSLSVFFPGAGEVPLTGPPFEATVDKAPGGFFFF